MRTFPCARAASDRARVRAFAEAQRAMHTMLVTLKGKMTELLAVAAEAAGDQQKAIAGASPIVTAALQGELAKFGFMPGLMGLMGGFAAFKAIIATPGGAELQKGATPAPDARGRAARRARRAPTLAPPDRRARPPQQRYDEGRARQRRARRLHCFARRGALGARSPARSSRGLQLAVLDRGWRRRIPAAQRGRKMAGAGAVQTPRAALVAARGRWNFHTRVAGCGDSVRDHGYARWRCSSGAAGAGW